LWRTNTIDNNALRLEEQFDGLKDVGLIVGDENANFVFPIRNSAPP